MPKQTGALWWEEAQGQMYGPAHLSGMALGMNGPGIRGSRHAGQLQSPDMPMLPMHDGPST